MARNNANRVSADKAETKASVAPETTEQQTSTTLSFATPTEFVELPTRGRFYPEGHPLHNQETVEIRYMTAKDEDILSSRTLLKKGLAIERFLQNVIVDNSIDSNELYIGDKNAIMLAARITGYGSEYETTVSCPVCSTSERFAFNLEEVSLNYGEVFAGYDVTEAENGTYLVKLPKSGFTVGVRLLTGKDERYLAQLIENKRKHRLPDTLLTDQFKQYIVSIEGHTDPNLVLEFVENMPALDSRYLRTVYQVLTPNVDLTQEYTCDSCGHEEEVDVPFTADFFWPRT